ncbi:MAG: NAD-dependent epimerase/dehydratase family protein [Patescibacteria group bacterium]
MKWKTVIVTGGAGFVGTHLVNALAEKAERVVVIDKVKPQKDQKNIKAIYKKLDIATYDLEEIFAKEKPQVVFHLAAHIDDRESVKEPIMNAEQNLVGSLRVFEACKKNLKGKIVFASTGGLIYGEQDKIPVSEDAVPRPLTPYAVSKLTGERYLYFYNKIHGLPYTAIRFSNSYGPWQDGSAECGAIAIFTARLLKGKEVHINNDGATTRDYVYIDDVVNAFLRAAESDVVGVYNIGTGVETSTLELFEKICEAVGVQASPIFEEEIEDLVKRSALDCKKAKKDLGWEPKVSLDEGIEKTVKWYHENV